jgi:hypothetical protein
MTTARYLSRVNRLTAPTREDVRNTVAQALSSAQRDLPAPAPISWEVELQAAPTQDLDRFDRHILLALDTVTTVRPNAV